MIGIEDNTPGTNPKIKVTAAEHSKPIVMKYLGLLRSDTLP